MLDFNAMGPVAALGSAASWAVGAFLFKSVGERLSPVAMTLAKGACSVVLLGLAVLLFERVSIDSDHLAYVIVSGIIGIALGDTFFFRALQGLTAQALLVLMVVGQVMTIALAAVFLNEKLAYVAVVGIPLVLFGVVTVLRATSSSEESGRTRYDGVVFGLLSVSCTAVSMVVMKKALGSGSHTFQATWFRMLSGTTGIFVYGLITRQIAGWMTPLKDRKLALSFVLAVAVVSFGGFWLGTVATKYCSVAVASTLIATEPAFGLLIAVMVFRQRVSGRAVAGTATTFMGVVLLTVPEFEARFARWIHSF